jgi:hypothetical protein
MSRIDQVEIRTTAGFVVVDARGRRVGRVECLLYGTEPEEPDALAVRAGTVLRRRFIVPTAAIDDIDSRTRVIGLGLEVRELRRFL